ncbi:MAG: hypothetical protein HQL51_02535 [Magnetococcales bacterium]|nr:hypothetical protein [Magnetococcales bacterium]
MDTPIPTEELADRFRDRIKRLIVRVSFEERSVLISHLFGGQRNISVSAFASKRHSVSASKNLEDFKKEWPDADVTELDTHDSLQPARDIAELIDKHHKLDGLQNTFIDITSFRREELLVLIAFLHSLNLPKTLNCWLGYVGAKTMATDWLARNVTDHRSVVAFPGEIWPSRNTKLVIMAGVGEHDRARSIIEKYEPAKVLLGMSRECDSINKEIYNQNREFFFDLVKQFDGTEKRFEFSARDPLQTVKDLEAAIILDDGFNIVIAPLSSKLSTIGAGLFAIRHPSVQICYAPVEEYNEETYSTPDDKVHIISLTDLFSSLPYEAVHK